MTRWHSFALAAAILIPASAWCASPFDGTWKADTSTYIFSGKPIVILVKNGVYHCKSCVPPQHFKADGKPHKTPGNKYHDMGSATIVSPNEVDLTFTKDGKTVETENLVASDDGMSLTAKGTDSSATNAAPVDFNNQVKRQGKLPKGALPVSGNWIPASVNLSDNALTVTYKVSGDSLTMTTPTGQSFTAKFSGPQVPYVGDPGTSTVAVKLVNDHTVEETDYRDGKPVGVFTTTVAADGKTAKVVNDFPMSGRHAEFTEKKS